jgi:hypothetical protein
MRQALPLAGSPAPGRLRQPQTRRFQRHLDQPGRHRRGVKSGLREPLNNGPSSSGSSTSPASKASYSNGFEAVDGQLSANKKQLAGQL